MKKAKKQAILEPSTSKLASAAPEVAGPVTAELAREYFAAMSYDDFCAVLGLLTNRAKITRWGRAGLRARAGTDRWNLWEWINWAVPHVVTREQKDESAAGNTPIDTQLKQARKEKLDLENAQVRGEFQRERDLAMAQHYGYALGFMMSEPKVMAGQLANKTADEVESLMTARNRWVCAQWSHGDFGLPESVLKQVCDLMAAEFENLPAGSGWRGRTAEGEPPEVTVVLPTEKLEETAPEAREQEGQQL